MHRDAIVPDNGGGSAFRDVGPDKWGFKFRQFANGSIFVLTAPIMGHFGYYIPNTEGGALEGKTLSPGSDMWAKVTAQIGEHPQQIRLRQVADMPKANLGGWAVHAGNARLVNGYGRAQPMPRVAFRARGRSATRRGSYGVEPGYGAPVVDTIQDILSGFTAEPEGEAGAFTATAVEAVPGIQSSIQQLTTPSTLDGMSKKLGRLKGQLAQTRDPVKRAMLEEQIATLEFKIANLKGTMASVTGTPMDVRPDSWIPFALVGSGVLALAAVVATRGRGRRR